MTRPRGRSHALSVTVVSGGFSAARGLGPWLEAHVPRSVRGSLTIKIVSDREMARLNGRFRGKAQPTDVLSFPGGPTGETGFLEKPPEETGFLKKPGFSKSLENQDLGDIAIAAGVARRQARALGHPVAVELRVLSLHGILHLLGYDHERDRGEMKAVEERWRRRAGLPAGLVSRTERPRQTSR